MTLASMFAADLLLAENDFPQVFTWRGKDYPCIARDQTDGHTLIDEGFSDDSQASLLVRLVVLTEGVPSPNDKVTYKGQEYRIGSAGGARSVDGLTVELSLVCLMS